MRNAIAEGRVATKALLCDINSAAWNDMRMACTEIFTPRTYLGRPHHLHIRHNQKLYIRSPSLSHPQAPSCTTYAQHVSLTHTQRPRALAPSSCRDRAAVPLDRARKCRALTPCREPDIYIDVYHLGAAAAAAIAAARPGAVERVQAHKALRGGRTTTAARPRRVEASLSGRPAQRAETNARARRRVPVPPWGGDWCGEQPGRCGCTAQRRRRPTSQVAAAAPE